jgi:spermidine synthase
LLLFLVILIPFFFYPDKKNNAVYSAESQYNVIKVFEENNELFLYLNNFFGFHSMSLDKKKITESYYDYFLITPILTNGKQVLILGNGAGTAMTQLSYFYQLYIDGIELDPVLTKVGKNILKLKPDRNEINIIHKDARNYLDKNDKLYDIIIIDLYAGSPYIPFHLSTVEFFNLVKEHLKKDGVLAINFPEYALNSDFETYYLNTINRFFPSLFITNHIILTFKEKKDLEFIKNKIQKFQSNEVLKSIFNEISNQIYQKEPTKNNLIFTDNLAPIDNLLFKILKM